MITGIIISSIVLIFTLGFAQVYNNHKGVAKKINFSIEYRNKFIEFSSKYFKTQDQWSETGDVDSDLYIWLTMNVSRIQNYTGSFGVMSYKPAFQNYMINKYQIIINTIPKFREGQVAKVDAGSVDDCLLRYIGYLEENQKSIQRELRNPIIWFREGIRQILSVPVFFLNWFGIISSRTLNSVKDSLIFKVVSGLIAFVTLVSGVVTIIVGYEDTLKFILKIFR